MTTENATRPEAAAAVVPVVTCRLCGSTDLRSFLDLGATPPCELFLTAAAVEEPEPTYPLHVRVCQRCLLAQIPPLITPEETFTEYAYFSSFSDLLGRARPPVRRRRGRAPRAHPRLLRGRGGQQRRLPAPARRRARHPLPGRRAVGQRRRGRPRQGRAHAHRVPHPGDRQAGARAARPGRPGLPQQRLRPHPRRRRLHRGPAGHGRRRRLGVDRGAAPAHAGGAHPVRHDLPRALPVLHAAQRPAGARLGRAHARRRRAAAHPRRLDPHVGAPE